MRRSSIHAVAVLCLLACVGQAAGRKALLLAVSQGVLPNSGPEGTKCSLAEREELGGVCLKVVFQDDTWFAEMRPRDWSPFSTLAFDVVNPAKTPVNLNLTIKYKGAVDYDTRVDKRVPLKPGKNACTIGLLDLTNNNGTRPDLSLVNIWSVDGPKGATLFFGDFRLESGAAAPPPKAPTPPATAPAAPPAQGIRIRGTFDITITGLDSLKIAAAPAEAPEPAPAPAPARKALLIPFSKGTMPTDVANAQLSLVEDPRLGGIALKATFPKDAWFADSDLKPKDWREFTSLTFVALNPGNQPVGMDITIKHKGTRDYDTRADKTFALAPGKNPISIPLTGLANNDGSRADLSQVNILTVSCGAEATILFGDFTLE